MRFLANENCPARLIQLVREQGHDVVWILEDAPGALDQVILARAVQESRILITFDRDCGKLAFQCGLPARCGIVLLRLRAATPEQLCTIAAQAIASRDDWTGKLSVIEPRGVRVRALGPASGD